MGCYVYRGIEMVTSKNGCENLDHPLQDDHEWRGYGYVDATADSFARTGDQDREEGT